MGPQADLRTLVPEITVEQLLACPEATRIDLRSPAEHAADHVPGAVSVPLLGDAERAVVGTLYAREGPEPAFREAREAVVSRVSALVEELGRAAGWEPPTRDPREIVERRARAGLAALERDLDGEPVVCPPEWAVVLYCWRGGLRSRSVVALARELGLERAVGLRGGYKAWRAAVIAGLAGWQSPSAFVLRGLTGVGKTLVLRELELLRPGWTVDLEELAGHRSSILGMVGLEPVGQRRFESRLFARLVALSPRCAVLEGESRKVGDVVLPARVFAALEGATNLLLEAPLERRIEVLREDYLATEGRRAELRRQLPWLEAKIGGDLVRLLDADRIEELVWILLERWYDPRYSHSERGRECAARIDSSDPARAAAEVAGFVDGRIA